MCSLKNKAQPRSWEFYLVDFLRISGPGHCIEDDFERLLQGQAGGPAYVGDFAVKTRWLEHRKDVVSEGRPGVCSYRTSCFPVCGRAQSRARSFEPRFRQLGPVPSAFSPHVPSECTFKGGCSGGELASILSPLRAHLWVGVTCGLMAATFFVYWYGRQYFSSRSLRSKIWPMFERHFTTNFCPTLLGMLIPRSGKGSWYTTPGANFWIRPHW